MINILSIAESECQPEMVDMIKKIFPKSPIGEYYVISTTEFQNPKNNEEVLLINTLFKLAHQGYSYLMINLNKV